MSTEELPRRLGNYVLQRRIAQGGMAELFLARKLSPGGEEADKQLAIKRILPQFAADEDFKKMFLNEARLAAMLNHALVIRTYDLGRAEDTLYIAMEYVDGVNLRDVGKLLRNQGKVVPPTVLASIGAKVAEALDYAHRLASPSGQPLKLVHRDVSPDNILLTRDGYVKLADFGIAKAFANHPATRTQSVKGKLTFMAPEQILGTPLDGRTDLYSLGVVLFVLATGRKPVSGANPVATMQAIVRTPPTPPTAIDPTFPPALERVILKLLEKEPARRYSDGGEVAAELQKIAVELGGTLTPRELSEFVTQALASAPEETGGLLEPELVSPEVDEPIENGPGATLPEDAPLYEQEPSANPTGQEAPAEGRTVVVASPEFGTDETRAYAPPLPAEPATDGEAVTQPPGSVPPRPAPLQATHEELDTVSLRRVKGSGASSKPSLVAAMPPEPPSDAGTVPNSPRPETATELARTPTAAQENDPGKRRGLVWVMVVLALLAVALGVMTVLQQRDQDSDEQRAEGPFPTKEP